MCVNGERFEINELIFVDDDVKSALICGCTRGRLTEKAVGLGE